MPHPLLFFAAPLFSAFSSFCSACFFSALSLCRCIALLWRSICIASFFTEACCLRRHFSLRDRNHPRPWAVSSSSTTKKISSDGVLLSLIMILLLSISFVLALLVFLSVSSTNQVQDADAVQVAAAVLYSRSRLVCAREACPRESSWDTWRDTRGSLFVSDPPPTLFFFSLSLSQAL